MRADRLVGDGVGRLGEEVEVAGRVAGLALGDRAEQRRDLGVALDVGLLREVQATAVRLALARERLLGDPQRTTVTSTCLLVRPSLPVPPSVPLSSERTPEAPTCPSVPSTAPTTSPA